MFHFCRIGPTHDQFKLSYTCPTFPPFLPCFLRVSRNCINLQRAFTKEIYVYGMGHTQLRILFGKATCLPFSLKDILFSTSIASWRYAYSSGQAKQNKKPLNNGLQMQTTKASQTPSVYAVEAVSIQHFAFASK